MKFILSKLIVQLCGDLSGNRLSISMNEKDPTPVNLDEVLVVNSTVKVTLNFSHSYYVIDYSNAMNCNSINSIDYMLSHL